MFVKVHKPKDYSTGGNKGSSARIFNYLDKENKGKLEHDRDEFFNNHTDKLTKVEAMELIDGNNTRLSKSDAKFYMFSINPSNSELRHLEILVEKQTKKPFDITRKKDRELFHGKLKNYTNNVMNAYAESFTRTDSKGNKLELHRSDFVYTAKIESTRAFHHWEHAVKHNIELDKQKELLLGKHIDQSNIKDVSLKAQLEALDNQYLRQDAEGKIQTQRGSIVRKDNSKAGRNHHVHVVVSRQTKSLFFKGEMVIDHEGNQLTWDKEKLKGARPMKLSPAANGRGDSAKHKLNGNKVQVGFNNEKFKTLSGELFNEMFNYKSTFKDQYNKNVKPSPNSKNSDKLGHAVQNKISNKIENELRGDVLRTEENIIKTVTNPVNAGISELKQKILDILKGEDLIK